MYVKIVSDNNCQNVCEDSVTTNNKIIGSDTTNKNGVIIFRDFTADKDFGT